MVVLGVIHIVANIPRFGPEKPKLSTSGIIAPTGCSSNDRSSSSVDLICQRCSEKLEHTIFLKSGFLIKEETQLSEFHIDDHADYDLIESSIKMNVLSLIEDEIILSLPVAPKHENDKCHYKKTDEMLNRIHPFADLKQKLYKN